jgi:methionyl-tRNA formyltransferase
MRLVFLGSGEFAVPSLRALVEAGHDVVGVVTQPDRESGRGRSLTPPPVKPVAVGLGLRVIQPAKVREAEADLRAASPQAQVVVAYGQILPRRVIDVAPLGTVNVHASLLPRYRGAAPIQWAIARGEAETGVTTMLIDEGLDTGPVLLARRLAVGAEETAASLAPKLAEIGAALLLESLAGLATGAIRPVPQDHSQATLAPLIRKQDGRVAWASPALEIERRIRAFDPWPGVTATWGERGVRLLRASVMGGRHDAAPGTVIGLDRSGIRVACGAGSVLFLALVQPESKRPMTAAAFAAGARIAVGSVLG